MPTLESNFKQEFVEMMRGRYNLALKNGTSAFSLEKFPVLSQPILPKGRVCLVRCIKEKFFERLNNTEVQLLLGKTVLPKRQVKSDGQFRKDAQGKYVTEQVLVPSGSVPVVSGLSIGLKRFVVTDGVKREWKVPKGFKYVDYFEQNGKRWYIYILPKGYVYRVNMNALIVSYNKLRTYYHGARLAMQNGTYLYLFVAPYSYSPL